MSTTRHLKVCRSHYDYTPKHASPAAGLPVVPAIQLKGKWLLEAGFNVNTLVKVNVQRGRLILTAKKD